MWRAVNSNWTSSGHRRRCSDAETNQKELEPRNISFYTIVTNNNGSLEAVHCHTHITRYDNGAKVVLAVIQIGPHQVTYDVVATPIHGYKMILK